MAYLVTKTYDHSLGLSATFRQWRAESHCRFIHGYALSIKLTFAADQLDRNNWVFDFGGLKPVKAWLVCMFDHKMLIAEDDPQRERLIDLASHLKEGHGCSGIDCPPVVEYNLVPAVGCEGFAKFVYDYVDNWLGDKFSMDCDIRGLRIMSVEVREHGGNSAIYERPN